MRKFAGIVESTTAPPTNCLWLTGKELKANINGEWVDLISTGDDTPSEEDNIVIIDLSDEQHTALLSGQAVTIENDNLIGSINTIKLRMPNDGYQIMDNIYGFGNNFVYRGYLSDLEEFASDLTYTGKIIYIEGFLNTTSGTFTFKMLDTDIPVDIIGLEIGNNVDVKNHNLALLNKYNLPYFFTQLDYGYGVGTFNSSNGGFIHIINAYGNDIFYTISTDGSISKKEDYIKPNEPYSVILTSDKIDVVLDNITADKVAKCGEIIITGTTGTVTYTRTADSTPTAIYFSDERKDGKITVLTYTASTKKITSAVINPYLPTARTSTIGGVKRGSPIDNIEVSSATVESVANKVNELLAVLRSAGMIDYKIEFEIG